MKNNPLIVQLAALSRKEMTRFADFAASPYFNKHKQVLALIQLLSEIYPDFSDKKCSRATLFQKLFPTEKHHQPQLAIVFTYALRLLERFLIVESLETDGYLADKSFYFSQLRIRGLNQFLKLEWEGSDSTRSTEQNETARDKSNVYLQKLRATTEQDAIAMQLGHQQTFFLEEKQRLLEQHFMLESLREACERIQRSRLLKTPSNESVLFEKMMELLNKESNTTGENPCLKVYFQLYNLLKHNHLDEYQSCKSTLRENEAFFGLEELQNLYNYLQNFCIQQINMGHQDFLKEVFNLYQLQLKSDLLLVDGILPEWHYKNIVTTGLRLDERQWVRDFIEDYHQLLAPTVALNAYSYNLATWHYHVGKTDAVLPLLLQVEYTDLRYNLDAKSLLLRTYFDLEEEEALLAHAEAFSQFVKRNKSLTDFQKKGYFNLIRFAQRAFKLKLQISFAKLEKWQETLQKLMADMAQAEPIFNKVWLQMKLEELKNEK